MFNSIAFLRYDSEKETNYLLLTDYCLSPAAIEITTPIKSPSLKKSNISNTLVALSLILFYDKIGRRIPNNLARYYQHIISKGFVGVDEDFIRIQLQNIDSILKTNHLNRYFKSILRYMRRPKINMISLETEKNVSDYLKILQEFERRRY